MTGGGWVERSYLGEEHEDNLTAGRAGLDQHLQHREYTHTGL